ncbi:FAD-dependent oxidoreductase, partial [Halolamina salina]
MSTERTDVVVIGAGPGGYVAAIRAAQRGLETTIVERGEPGGVCLNHGCIPSKALIDVARAAGGVGRMADRGVHAEPTVAFDELSEWQDSVVDRLTGGVEKLLDANGVTYREGTAHFQDDHTVEIDPPSLTVDSTTLSFEHAVIATGSRPIELPGFSFDDEPVLSSRDVLDLSERPDRLLVVGAGY